MARVWVRLTMLAWLLAHADLVVTEYRAAPVLRARVAQIEEQLAVALLEVQRFKAAWAFLSGDLATSRPQGRHLHSVGTHKAGASKAA